MGLILSIVFGVWVTVREHALNFFAVVVDLLADAVDVVAVAFVLVLLHIVGEVLDVLVDEVGDHAVLVVGLLREVVLDVADGAQQGFLVFQQFGEFIPLAEVSIGVVLSVVNSHLVPIQLNFGDVIQPTSKVLNGLNDPLESQVSTHVVLHVLSNIRQFPVEVFDCGFQVFHQLVFNEKQLVLQVSGLIQQFF